MAYLTKEMVSSKRAALKAAFPLKAGWKFSVRNRNHSTLCVTVVEFPKDYDFPGHISVNPYGKMDPEAPVYREKGFSIGEKEVEALEKMKSIMRGDDWYDNSDIMTDYFDTAFYMNLEVGTWEKPAVASKK